jgi:hypothetical protein
MNRYTSPKAPRKLGWVSVMGWVSVRGSPAARDSNPFLFNIDI